MSSVPVEKLISELQAEILIRLYEIEQQANPDPRKFAISKTQFEQAMLWLKATVVKEQ